MYTYASLQSKPGNILEKRKNNYNLQKIDLTSSSKLNIKWTPFLTRSATKVKQIEIHVDEQFIDVDYCDKNPNFERTLNLTAIDPDRQ